MAKHIAQFRLPDMALPLFNDGSQFKDGWSKNLLQGPASSLSIYGMPGTEFKITQNQSSHSFILNNTGLFSVNFEEQPIKGLYLNSKNSNITTANILSHVLIIDYIYIDEEAGR